MFVLLYFSNVHANVNGTHFKAPLKGELSPQATEGFTKDANPSASNFCLPLQHLQNTPARQAVRGCSV